MWRGFDILATHAIYNRAEMDRVVEDAVYLTILRDPVQRFLSAFQYYNYTFQMHLGHSSNPVADFVSDPEYYLRFVEYGQHQVINGQLYDLGFITKQQIRVPTTIEARIYSEHSSKQLDEEFDLVLIAEHLDESLVVMKRLLCWEFDDIVYIPQRVTTNRYSRTYTLDSDSVAIIQTLNKADLELYRYFNESLWNKIANYGPDFQNDLQTFRYRLSQLWQKCGRATNFPTEGDDEQCGDYLRLDDENIRIARDQLRERLDNRCRVNCAY